jgi:tRNA pseudouridine38-40 synthase
MHSWVLRLAWEGTAYVGWQRQSNGLAIQQVCEEAACEFLGGEKVRLRAAGRTDAGVHALSQVVGMQCEATRASHEVVGGLNRLLPDDIRCLSAEPGPPNFDPRSWSLRKTYRYRLLQRYSSCPFRHRYTWHRPSPLNLPAMRAGAEALVGSHDFSSFRAQGCGAAHPNRTLERVEVRIKDDELWLEFAGDAFLRHQVRIMVGTLVGIGAGRFSGEEMKQILSARDRHKAGPTAPACGLCLVSVELADTPR